MTLIVVAGALANKPLNGGEAWVRLNWLLGLRQLGFQVHLVEQIASAACRDALGQPAPFRDSVNVAYFRSVATELGLADTLTLLHTDSGETVGRALPELAAIADAAACLVNISGHLTYAPLFARFRQRVYIDIDPGYTQLWAMQGLLGQSFAAHDRFFTIGENIGTAHCAIPTGGIDWQQVRQPVVLSAWPAAPQDWTGRFTTVASWRGGYGRVEYQGTQFGQKAHQWRWFLTLPAQAPYTFEAALDIHPADAADRDALLQHGWHLVEPRHVAGSPTQFREYVQRSDAEFSVAQGIYVDTRCGWMSDRTIRYLASGKPALVQDTGITHRYPVGNGLLLFQSMAEAVAGADAIAHDYRAHCQAARALAERHFAAAVVLAEFVARLGIGP